VDVDEAFAASRRTEDAAERKRYADQLARADLTPVLPAPRTWLVESCWRPLPDTPSAITTAHADERAAEHHGLQLACCSGLTRLRVIAPDGSVRYSFDRDGNFWLCHHPTRPA
jgi:hypothetical protein